MSIEARDSGPTVPSRIPLEILIPVLCSVLILCIMTTVLLHRTRHKLATSPSLLVFSDPEANRQWLNELASLKELGLAKLKNMTRVCSIGLEVKCRGEGDLNDNICLAGLPARPQSAFFPGWRAHSSHRGIVRTSWVQSLFHPSRKQFAPENVSVIPEIRITVPSTTGDGPNPSLPQNRRWSRIIAHDIGLARKVLPGLRSLALADKTQNPKEVAVPITRRSQYPPNSMNTLPLPARRRLSSNAETYSGLRHDMHAFPIRPLSPIAEVHESLNSFRSGLLSSYGLALLHSSTSVQMNSSSTIDRSVCSDSTETKGMIRDGRGVSPVLGLLSSVPDAGSISSIYCSSLMKSELCHGQSMGSSLAVSLKASASNINKTGLSVSV